MCEGRGELKTAQTVCYQILRELLREARQFNAREFRILASQQVIDMFLDEESQKPRDALGLHRQAGIAAGRKRLQPGAVRHHPDVALGRCDAPTSAIVHTALAAFLPPSPLRLLAEQAFSRAAGAPLVAGNACACAEGRG